MGAQMGGRNRVEVPPVDPDGPRGNRMDGGYELDQRRFARPDRADDSYGGSRRHIEIRFDGQTATLYDLGSTNGTIVNGHRVQSWQLADGDVIRIGHSVLVYRQAPG